MENATIPQAEYDRLRRIEDEARVVAEDIEDWRASDPVNQSRPLPLVLLHGDLLKAALEGRPRPDLDSPKYHPE